MRKIADAAHAANVENWNRMKAHRARLRAAGVDTLRAIHTPIDEGWSVRGESNSIDRVGSPGPNQSATDAGKGGSTAWVGGEDGAPGASAEGMRRNGNGE